MLNVVVTRSLVAGAAGLAMLALMPAASFAVGDTPAPPKRCGQHAQGSSAWKKCMGTKLKDDAEHYSVGYWMAKGGDYASALDVLRAASNQADPRIQTMIGFSLRKLGRVDEAMGYYRTALAANPNLTSTRQYLGEAFLQTGRPDQAREQLSEIARRCGTACEDYRLLADAIVKAQTAG